MQKFKNNGDKREKMRKLKLMGEKKMTPGKESTINLISTTPNLFIKYFSSLKYLYMFKEIM